MKNNAPAWVALAESDWLCIRNNLEASETPWNTVAFHAQQAAEKYLKALMIANGTDPEKIHDLSALLKGCIEIAPSLVSLAADCEDLTRFVIDGRYPGVDWTWEKRLALEAVAAADRICSAVRPLLQPKS